MILLALGENSFRRYLSTALETQTLCRNRYRRRGTAARGRCQEVSSHSVQQRMMQRERCRHDGQGVPCSYQSASSRAVDLCTEHHFCSAVSLDLFLTLEDSFLFCLS